MKHKKNLKRMLVSVHTHKYILSFLIVMVISIQGQAQTWSLQQCIDTAQVHNKNLQISRNNIAVSEQKQKEAMSNLIPKVNVVGDYKYFTDLPYQLMPMSTFNPMAPEGQFKEAQFGVAHNMSASIQVALPLYNSQIYGGIRTTKIASEINELKYKKTEEQIYYEITNLYYNIQILQHQLAFIDSNIVNTTKLLENMQLLHQQLMIKRTDVSKVELQKEQLITQRELIANNVEQVLNALKFSMGITTNQDIQIETDIQHKSINEYSHLPTIDLQLTSMYNRLLLSELKTLKSSRLPSVSLYGSYGQTGFGYDKKPNDFLKFFPTSFVGVQVSYPLFNGTVTYRKINQKKIEIQNNELQISLVTDQNNMLIGNANNRRGLMQKTISNTLAQINLASTVYEQTLLQQKEGTANLTDVLLADNALREAQQSYLSAIVEFLRADLELKKLTGNITLTN
ncbi:MAG: TolC family protein [Bacteroidales bacterium]|nr:TolC family protein [Bacteroidales bacterium]MDD4216207.1 TolC family protein [Bacteroidales bacterium]MDY0142531.1 TolC family protein [Bacteroidales bacterium]